MEQTVNPEHTKFHPKWYRRRIPLFWWLENLTYIKFISRELTSLCVAYVAVVLLLQTWAIGRGVEAHDAFLRWLQYPAVIVVHVVILLGLLFHTITWLGLAPKALVLRLGGRRIPDRAVLVAHHLAWLLASLLVIWVVLGR